MITVSIGGGHYLQENAALSVKRMRKAGAPVGPINSSTRSFAQQLDWYQHQGEPGYPTLAADPYESKHVWRPNDPNDKGARALDVNEPLRRWMVKYGAKYGWIRTIASEPWHFEYHESRDQFLNAPVEVLGDTVTAPVAPPELEEEEEDIDMERIVQALIERHLGTKLNPDNPNDRITLNFWLDFYMDNGRELLRYNIAESTEAHRWSVNKRYITELGRLGESNAALDAYWAQFNGDLNAISTALRASGEAAAFRAKTAAERQALINAALAGRVLG